MIFVVFDPCPLTMWINCCFYSYHILEAKLVKLVYLPSFVTLVFQNGLEYRNGDGRLNNNDGWPTLRRNLVSVGPVTLEFMRLE